MLADRLDILEPASVDRCCDAGHEAAWVRRAGGEPESDERAEPESSAVEGVAFGHGRTGRSLVYDCPGIVQ